jgi:hypothetical protein
MGYIVTVRAALKGNNENASKKLHDDTAAQARVLGKSLGNVSHHPYLSLENPREFFDVDVWDDNLDGLKKFFSDPSMAKVMGELFESRPDINIYADNGWLRW